MKNQFFKRVFSSLKQVIAYGGIDKNDYQNIRPLIAKTNLFAWRVISFFIFVMALASFISSLGVEEIQSNWILYTASMAVAFILFFISLFIKKENYYLVHILVIVDLIFSLIFGLCLSFIDSRNWPGITYFVLLVACPAFVITKPYITGSIVIAVSSIYIGLCFAFKTGEARNLDVYNAIIFSIVALFSLTFSSLIRIRGFKAEYEIDRLAKYDGLTGLENELSYVSMQEEVNSNIRLNKQDKFAVFMCDVNGVKPINDTYGHTYGCAIIVEAGHYINSLFKNSRCFHVGGDEYMVKVQGEDYENREVLFNAFKEKMENYFIVKDDISLRVSVAYGLSCYLKGKDKEFADVLKRADKEMYECKKIMKERQHIASRKEEMD